MNSAAKQRAKLRITVVLAKCRIEASNIIADCIAMLPNRERSRSRTIAGMVEMSTALQLKMVLAAITLGSAGIASAQDGRENAANPKIEAFRSCQSITDSGARLACFDAASTAFVAAADAGEFRILDKESVRKTRRRLFGFALPDLDIFGGSDKDSDPPMDMLETTISAVQRVGADWILTTPEGGTWEIQNAPFSFRDPKVGDKVVFKRAALGSYFIRVADRTGVKGRRIR